MADERFTNAVKVKDVMTILITSEGWSFLDGVLEEKEKSIVLALLDPGNEMSDVTLREHRMAAANIRMVRMLPKAMLEDASETIEQFAEVEEAEPEPEEEEE